MKGQRDMFYSNYQAGGFQEPNVIVTPPQGYNINTQYSAFGPGFYPTNNQMMAQMQPNAYANNYNDNYNNLYA